MRAKNNIEIMEKDGVTIITTAYNEEGNIADAVHSAIDAVSDRVSRFEIILVDDASLDDTERIGRHLALSNDHVRYVRRSSNGGLGRAFTTGIQHASMPYVTWFPGDNDTSAKSLKDLVEARHDADIVITYSSNPWTRLYLRRFISWSFTKTLNVLLGYHMKYYNGCFIAKTDLVRRENLKSTGHAIFAEIKVRIISKGYSYKQIPFLHIKRKTGMTTAFRLKNIVATLQTVWILFYEVRLKR